MCTSFTYEDTTAHHYLARTLDFPTTTPWHPLFLPRQHPWQPAVLAPRTTTFAILGAGRQSATTPTTLLADALNERGLAVAELAFPGGTHYAPRPVFGHLNLAPQDVITWLLGEHATVADVATDLAAVSVVAKKRDDDQYVQPFHWLLSDTTGQTAVLEPTTLALHLQPNPSQILTNTPPLATQIRHLNAWLHCSDTTFTSQTLAALRQAYWSHRPLPNRSVPTDRFIKMAVLRWGSRPLSNPTATITQILTWLAAVALPLDPTKRTQTNHNYTHYRSVFDLNDRQYTFISRDQNILQQNRLTPQMAAQWDSVHLYPGEMR